MIHPAPGGLFNQQRVFLITHQFRDCLAGFLEAREIPEIGEVAALLRFHGLNPTIVPVEEDAFTGRLLIQRQSVTILGEAVKR
jgi:hypothetical protein